MDDHGTPVVDSEGIELGEIIDVSEVPKKEPESSQTSDITFGEVEELSPVQAHTSSVGISQQVRPHESRRVELQDVVGWYRVDEVLDFLVTHGVVRSDDKFLLFTTAGNRTMLLDIAPEKMPAGITLVSGEKVLYKHPSFLQDTSLHTLEEIKKQSAASGDMLYPIAGRNKVYLLLGRPE